MANILDKFRQTSVGSTGRILDYTSKLSSSGDFSKIYDLDAIITSWNNILITPKGSKDHDPEFGSNLYLYLFEPADTETQEGIKNEIIESISTYDNRASIDDIKVLFFSNKKGFNVTISIEFDGEISDITINLDESMYNNLS